MFVEVAIKHSPLKLLGEIGQIEVNIFKPFLVKLANVETYFFAFDHPVFYELVHEADFGCYRWNTIGASDKIVSVSTNFLRDNIVCVSHLEIWWKSCLGCNLSHDWQYTWCSSFNIVWTSSVEWPHEAITIRMEINDESYLILVRV